MIEGVLSAYSVGDIVSANCTSGKSNPTANLSWHINGVKVGSAGVGAVSSYCHTDGQACKQIP
jgi:hypothetical protein